MLPEEKKTTVKKTTAKKEVIKAPPIDVTDEDLKNLVGLYKYLQSRPNIEVERGVVFMRGFLGKLGIKMQDNA